ncbi:MAG: PKD domain-containing protein [Acidobacteria bacterium]|nr:PKD domain-containing protein [Acidobacteriota bacterium]
MKIRELKIFFILIAMTAGGLFSSEARGTSPVSGGFSNSRSSAVDSAIAAVQVPPLWTRGGVFAGSDGIGQAGRMSVDLSGNIAIVSGPAFGRDLAVTSYTSEGVLRWTRTIIPLAGTFVGDWIVSSPNGDITALGRSLTSSGLTSHVVVVHYSSDGTFQWRVDSTSTILTVGRLLVDAGGNVYFSYNSILYKYSPAGVRLWSASTSVRDAAASISPDGADVILAGALGGNWSVTAFDTGTGTRRWLTTSAEGTAASDLVVDAERIYVAGQGTTGVGTPAITQWLTVIAYDRVTGAKIWRTDKRPSDSTGAAGGRIARALDGSLVVTGHATRGFLDWYTAALNANGTVRWEAVRDGGLNTDEIPSGIIAMANGTTVVTGRGGPTLPGGFWPGYTVGYGPTGVLLWEGRSQQATVWASALPNGDVCATGGYDALITCFRPGGIFTPLEPVAVMTVTPSSGTSPLNVAFNGSGSIAGGSPIVSWAWDFGDGSTGSGAQTSHIYTTPGTYIASLTVTDMLGVTSLPVNRSILVNAPNVEAPSAPTAVGRTPTSIRLAWTNGATVQSEVRIERCRGSNCADFAEVAVVAGTATGYINIGLTPGTYRYRVRAFNSPIFSAYSNIAKAATVKKSN